MMLRVQALPVSSMTVDCELLGMRAAVVSRESIHTGHYGLIPFSYYASRSVDKRGCIQA